MSRPEDLIATGPPCRIVTPRLLIRGWEPADARPLRAAIDRSDSHLRPWIPWMAQEPRSLADTLKWLRLQRANFDLGRDFRYAIYDREERSLLGETGLYPRVGVGAREIGYWIGVDHTGHGYAREAAAAMVKLAFEFETMRRVEIHCAVENAASQAVPRQLGFTLEATLPGRYQDSEGAWHDMAIWTLWADDYPSSPAAELVLDAYDQLGDRKR